MLFFGQFFLVDSPSPLMHTPPEGKSRRSHWIRFCNILQHFSLWSGANTLELTPFNDFICPQWQCCSCHHCHQLVGIVPSLGVNFTKTRCCGWRFFAKFLCFLYDFFFHFIWIPPEWGFSSSSSSSSYFHLPVHFLNVCFSVLELHF